MGRLSNQPELPRPELNPLLNPRLAENMGRWAEVYFTAPPERRDEAVADLLRELDSETGSEHTEAGLEPPPHALTQDFHSPQPAFAVEPERTRAAAPTPVASCPVCGHDNPDLHQFCGMCGSGLRARDAASAPATRGADPNATENTYDAGGHDSPAAGSRRWHAEPVQSFPEPGAESDELSLFRSISSAGYNKKVDWTDESTASTSYRGYVGMALAVILLSLGYLFWRSTQTSPSAHQVPSAPPQAAPETAPPAATTNQARPEAPSTQASSPAPANDNRLNRNEAAAPAGEVKPAASKLRTTAASVETPAALTTAAGYGGEELAVAERYLNGTNGQARESSEAAKWLWKSVAKHNSAASLLLAELYLKGDGVQKNCDQARVLLDAAAIKGVPGAGDRLRHLQAFGCQ